MTDEAGSSGEQFEGPKLLRQVASHQMFLLKNSILTLVDFASMALDELSEKLAEDQDRYLDTGSLDNFTTCCRVAFKLLQLLHMTDVTLRSCDSKYRLLLFLYTRGGMPAWCCIQVDCFMMMQYLEGVCGKMAEVMSADQTEEELLHKVLERVSPFQHLYNETHMFVNGDMRMYLEQQEAAGIDKLRTHENPGASTMQLNLFYLRQRAERRRTFILNECPIPEMPRAMDQLDARMDAAANFRYQLFRWQVVPYQPLSKDTEDMINSITTTALAPAA